MTDNLLYFPYINMPKSTWTTISVLYWNEVHAIVPDLYKDRPNRLEDNMRQLVEAGLVNQVFPYQYVCHLPNFDRAFLALIDAPDFNLQAKQQAFKQGQVSRIHIQKFSEGLLRELEERRIVQREDWEWYHMERHTARLFMTYLATVISKTEEFTPATDSSRNIDFSLNENRFSGYRLAARNRFLNDLMPYPITAHPYRLRDFKDIYSDQLGTFRNRLEQIIIEITNIRDRESREIYYQLKLREIMERRDEIYARLNEFDFGKVVFGTVFGLVAAGLAFDTGHPLVGSFAFVNAVYSALEGYDRSDITRGDFAYLALIDTKFGMPGRRLQ